MSRKFWLLIVALLVLMLALEYQMPRRFQWEPTFAHADRHPFGCYVFDSVFSQEMPHGYTVCRKSLSQLALQDTTPRSIVICSSQDYFSFKTFMNEVHVRDTIFWMGDTLHYMPTAYLTYRQLISSCLLDTAVSEPLAKIYDEDAVKFAEEHISKDSPYMNVSKESLKLRVADVVALSYPVGKGEIIFVTTPLLMTNYGILDNPAYVHRLMNRLKDLPVVRTEAYMPNYNVAESSPFRELLKRPPLRWALYLVLLGVVLLMGFGARRRQRAIPVEAPPRNYQLDFIRHIGTLQYLKQK